MTAILGIDPGAAGGWVILGGEGGLVDLGRMDKLDEREHADLVAGWTVTFPSLFAYVERAQAFPRMGVAGAFNYGKGYGMWLGMLAAAGIGYETVPAAAWQKALGLSGAGGGRAKNPSGHKRALVEEARRRWPELPKHSGVCDASLIAEYGRRMRNGAEQRRAG